jgi:hypothetical protein
MTKFKVGQIWSNGKGHHFYISRINDFHSERFIEGGHLSSGAECWYGRNGEYRGRKDRSPLDLTTLIKDVGFNND